MRANVFLAIDLVGGQKERNEEINLNVDNAIFDEWTSFHRISRRSLSRARDFQTALGISNEAVEVLPIIGVVGSKGKGTAATYAAATLTAAGLRTGLITSPALISNRDRIRIDGQALTDTEYEVLCEQVANARSSLSEVDPTAGYLSPTGIFIIAGTRWLMDAECDVIVVEAGLGGISDEISLLPIDVVAVLEIFGEHLDVIGPTVLDVARDKLGIIRNRTRGVVSITQSDDVRRILETRCDLANLSPVYPGLTRSETPRLRLPLGFGRANALVGIHAAQHMLSLMEQAQPDEASLARVFNSIRYPGRLSLHTTPTGGRLMIDSAITRDGLVTALLAATEGFGAPPENVYISVPSSKDFLGFVNELSDRSGMHVTFVELDRPHLAYPSRADWDGEWIQEDCLDERVREVGTSLFVGTISFTTRVLQSLGYDASTLYAKAKA